MCFFNSGGGSKVVASTPQADEEKKDTAVKKARLLGTSGQNKGAELSSSQGQSIRRVFG